jgi:3-carboxy-cis,cis-muconate cycloisomerase
MNADGSGYLFSTEEMTEVFALPGQLCAMMQFEWALACALEKHEVAAAGSGDVLKGLSSAEFVDATLLQSRAVDAGNIAIPFIEQLTVHVEQLNEKAARAIHLGATSQDVLDTALVLQMRTALRILREGMNKLDAALAAQVRRHAGTVMSGRTWLQPGPPTTLGLKLAGTLASLRRHRARFDAAAERALVLEFGGAVGTLAALGDIGGPVSAEMARVLELKEPDLPWHSQRDNVVEVGQVLALLVGTLGKFARDVALLMQAEVAEAAEPTKEDAGGSSTMPQKRNPVACATVLACATRAPGLAATLLGAMPQEHERGLGLWQAEWETLPELFRLTAVALARSIDIAEGLKVDTARMTENLSSTRGLPQAEAISVALSKPLGRAKAHAIARKAARESSASGKQLATVLKTMPEVTAHLTAADIDRLLEPGAYLGSAQRFIERVLADSDRR